MDLSSNTGAEGIEYAVESKYSTLKVRNGFKLSRNMVIKDEIETEMRLYGMTDLMRDSNPQAKDD